MKRKEIFKNREIYHIVNRSIASFNILRERENCLRFMKTLDYYNNRLVEKSYSRYLQDKKTYEYQNVIFPKKHTFVKFISYGLMPTHYHLLLKILDETNFSSYIGNVENSYSRYINLKFKRRGPLWESRFKAIRIRSEEQLLHVSRYIHLNPVTDYLVKKPEEWEFSSYKDYINNERILSNIISEITIKTPQHYKKFVENQIDYQRRLKRIKRLILE